MKRSVKESYTSKVENNFNSKNDRYYVQSPKHSFETQKSFFPEKLDKQNKMKRFSVNYEESHNISDFITKYDARQSAALNCVSSSSNLLMSVKVKEDKSKHIYYLSNVISSFNTDKPSSFEQLCRSHLTTSLDFMKFVHKKNKKLLVPAPTPQKLPYPTRQTIIFDLDETLIHCNENLSHPHDIAIPIQFPDKNLVTVGINIRPYVQ